MLSTHRSRMKSVVALSFSSTLAFVIAVLAIAAISGETAEATTYTLTSTTPVTNWSDVLRWNGGTGTTYPGQSAGDTAVLTLTGATINIDVPIANPVIVQVSGALPFTIPAGGQLVFASGSSSIASNTYTINGGTLTVASGATLSAWAGPIVINSGTLNVAGALSVAPTSAFNFNGGTINGGGTVTIGLGGSATFSGSSGAMTLDNVTFVTNGTTSYTSGSNTLSLNNGAILRTTSTGTLSLPNSTAINTNNVGSPKIDNQGSISGGGSATINVDVDNSNTISLTGGTQTLTLAGGGNHTGTFNTGSGSNTISFNGAHAFNSGWAWGGTGTFNLAGGSSSFNTTSSINNLVQQAGTLNGSGNLTITNSFDWKSGTQNGAGVTAIGSSCTATIDPTSAASLDGRAFSNGGILNYAPTTGFLTLDNGASITNTGTIDLQNAGTIFSNNATTSHIDNAGSAIFKKTGGSTSTVNPSVVFNGNSQIKVNAGLTLAFNNGTYPSGGSIGGPGVVIDLTGAGSSLQLAGGTFVVNGAGGLAVNGSGLLRLTNSATMKMNSGPLSVTNFQQDSSSTLIATGSGLNVTGTYQWNGGTIDGSSVSANVVTIPVGSTMNVTGFSPMTIDNTAVITNNGGTIDYNSATNPLAINNGGKIANTTGSFTWSSSLGMTTNNVSSPSFSNGGTLTRSGGATTPGLPVPITNTGTITLNGGNLQIQRGGTSTGSIITTTSGDRFEVANANTFSINSFTGPGVLGVVSGGTLFANGAITVPNLELQAGGVATAGSIANGFNVTTLKWLGGSFNGPGFTAVSGTSDLTSLAGTPALNNNWTFTNNGTFNYTPSFALTFNNSGSGATFNNAGIFNITGNGTTSVSGAGHIFTNSGTVKKTSGGGTFAFTVPFVNNASGIVDEQDPASTIAFTTSSTQLNGGSMKASNATGNVDFGPSGSLSVTGGSFAGPGAINFKGALVSFATNTQTLPPIVNLSAGSISTTVALTVPNAAALNWSGGSITGSGGGGITIQSGGALNDDTTTSSLIWNAIPLTINSGGNVNWNAGANSIVMQSSANVANAGTFTVATNGTLGNSTASFTNTGLLKHTGTGTFNLTMPLTNNGTVSSQGGTVSLLDTTTVNHAGTFDAQAGTFLDFSAGTHNLNAGTSLTGTGTFKIAGATVNANTTLSAANLGVLSGSLSGAGNVTVTNALSWAGGTMSGAGTTTVANTGTATLSTSALALSRNLTLNGNTSHGGPGLTASNAITITNNATFTSTSSIGCSCTPTPSTFINSGTLAFSGATTHALSIPITGSGALNVGAGATVNDTADSSFGAATIDGPTTFSGITSLSTVSGVGSITDNGGSLTVGSTFNLATLPGPNLIIPSGTVTLNGASSIAGLSLTSGTLNGTGNISLTGNSTWTSGTIGGSGTLTNSAATPATFTATGSTKTLSRSFINNGPASLGNISISPGVTITNNNLLNAAGDLVSLAGVPAPTISNSATGDFERQGVASPLTIDPAFTTAGTFGELVGGITTFTNGFTQTASGTFKVTINGTIAGTQYGQANVTGNLNLAGTMMVVNPLGYTPANGDSYKVLTFTGTRTGDFTTYNFPPPGPVGFLQSSYITGPPAALQITATTQVADIGVTQSGPASVNQSQNATIVVTVANVGPSNAASVVLTDTFSGGTYVSATPSAGTCSGTGPITCNFGTIASGNNATLTLVLAANTPGTITNNASATTTTFDSNNTNDAASPLNITVNASADVAVTQSAPPNVTQNQNATIVVNVANSGPSTATSVNAAVTLAGGTFVSATPSAGTCTGTLNLTCSLGNMASAGNATITIVMNASGPGPITSNASASSPTFDPNTSNNSATASIVVGALSDLAITKTGPASTTANGQITYTITVTNNGPSTAANVTINDLTPTGLALVSTTGGCPLFPCNLGTMTNGQVKTITATYGIVSQNVPSFTNTASVASANSDPVSTNNSASATTTVGCTAAAQAIAPVGGTLVTSPVHFSWTAVANAASYEVFTSNNGAPSASAGTTSSTSLDATINSDGSYSWFVVATVPTCGTIQSNTATFTICGAPGTPLPSVVTQTTSGQTFTIQWDAVAGATKYEIDEANNAAFTNATTTSTTSTSASFTRTAAQSAQSFFYRVRAFSPCAQAFGPNSTTLRVIIVPLPPKDDPNPNVVVPAGSQQPIVQQIFIPGIVTGNFTYVATTDEPWTTITPQTGILTPNGVTLTLTTNPSNLPNGTFTSSLIVTLNPVAQGRAVPDVTTVVNIPVSISLVTPVTPTSTTTPPANALVIPSVGHLDGIGSHWQSDIRVSNTAATKQQVVLNFTPSDLTQSMKSTTITIDPGATTALDDIVRNWYGAGITGDAASGTLEVHPAVPTQSLTTLVASSRTYNVAASGTLGQFIPAIPFSAFVGKGVNNAAATILSLQQIAQSAAYRTNFGVVEASGKSASVLMSILDDTGKKLKDLPIDLAPFQQVALNSVLASNNISLPDGRVEVKVASGDGKISAFASVIDNLTNDPLLVSGVPLGATNTSRYVLPGVADINNGFASWRTDMRVFNASPLRQTTTFTLVPLTGTGNGQSLVANATLEPGEVKTFDNILQTLFGVQNMGGALHVTTPTAAPLVVSGRTYNQTSAGTYGQFIGAVTAADAVGGADRALQILQVENSSRYRTNIGIVEVTGQPATVEMSIILPDSRVTPKLQIPLAANEYRQFSPAIDLGLGNIYNARVAIRVTSGVGRVTAYGSVIDMKTQDPTYVPAQ